MNFSISDHWVSLLVLIYITLLAIFCWRGKLDMFLDPQKFLIGLFLEFLTFLFIAPVRMCRRTINGEWRKSLLMISTGSILSSLIFLFSRLLLKY